MVSILVACERSQIVTSAFRARGFDAWSCDLEPVTQSAQYNEPDCREYHLCRDVLWVMRSRDWDCIIAFPPCTHLCVSGSRHFAAKRADGRQQRAIDFFMLFVNNPCKYIAIENPIGIMSRVWKKPTQIIQPWMFGEDAAKATCLWLKHLPKLEPTLEVLPTHEGGVYANQTRSGQNKLGPSEDRAYLRAETYPGIADAMAEQWGDYLINEMSTM